MTKIAYIFGDALTGEIIEEIALQGVSMISGIGAQGDFRGTLHLDQTGKNNKDLIDATKAGRNFVICERDSVPIWGGIVWTRTYQSQAKTLQLYGKSFQQYPYYRTIQSDLSYTDIEQRNIFIDLWTQMMSDPKSIQFTIPSSFPTVVTKSLDVKSFEYKSFGQTMDAIANGDDGFDWTIDVNRVGGAYTKTLRIGYPTIGSTELLHIDYSGPIINYWENESMADRGTHFFGVGAGEGSTMLVQPVTHTDLVSSGFPRYDVVLSLKSINNANILSGLTVQYATAFKAGQSTLTVELKGDQTPEFGSYGLGDSVRLWIVDPLHSEPVDQQLNARILGWEYYPPSDEHIEYVRLTLGGSS